MGRTEGRRIVAGLFEAAEHGELLIALAELARDAGKRRGVRAAGVRMPEPQRMADLVHERLERIRAGAGAVRSSVMALPGEVASVAK